MATGLAKKPLCQLNNPLIALVTDALQYLPNERLEPRFPPVVACRHLRTPGIALARGLQHRLGRSLVEAWIIPFGEIESPPWITPLAGILINECA